MNIQQNLNALLTTGAVIGRTSDLYAENVAERKHKKIAENLEALDVKNKKNLNVALKTEGALGPKTQQILDTTEDIAGKIKENAEQRAINKPTRENFAKMAFSDNMVSGYKQNRQQLENKEILKAKAEQDAYQGQVATIETTRGQRLGVEDRLEILRNARKTYGGK